MNRTSIFIVALCGAALLCACPDNFTPPIVVSFDTNTQDTTVDTSIDTKSEEMGMIEMPPGYGDIVWDEPVVIRNSASPNIEFDVPADAISVHISVIGQVKELYGIGKWINGDGGMLVTDGWVDTDPAAPALCLFCANRVNATEGAFATIAPNNQNVTLAPGTHTISVFGFRQVGFQNLELEERVVYVRVAIKRAPQPPTDGVLDINFYFTNTIWTAETAQTSASFETFTSEMDRVFAQTGIRLGEFTYNDIPEDFQIVSAIILPGSNVNDLWSFSADQPRAALNVFLVREIYALAAPGFGVVLGISGGIPGPNVTGTSRSGVAVAIDAADTPPGTLTYAVTAHEIGHHLGLFHSSESMGNVHDQLNDTAMDDPTNIMFYAGNGQTFSPTQASVMRSNVWVNTGERE